jgi:Ca2+-binding EF-hand superfamily protein
MPPKTTTTTATARRATSPAVSTTATKRAATPTASSTATARRPAASTTTSSTTKPATSTTTTATTTTPRKPATTSTTNITTTAAARRSPTTAAGKTSSPPRSTTGAKPAAKTAAKSSPTKPGTAAKAPAKQPVAATGDATKQPSTPQATQSAEKQTTSAPVVVVTSPKKPEPGKLPLDTEQMSSDIHELNVEIKELDDQINDRDKVRAERERYLDYQDDEWDFVLPPIEECQRQAQEAELLLVGAQEELRMAEKSKSMTLPQFELVGKNKDAAVAKTASLKKEIDEAELQLERSEAEIKKLEKNLEKASSVYKAERERRAILVDKLETELEELRKVVELSVVSMLPIDDDPNVPPGLESLKHLWVLVSNREHQISASQKLEREVSADIEMKKQHAEAIKKQRLEDELKMKEMREAQLSAVRSSIWNARSDLEKHSETILHNINEGRAALRNPRVASDAPGGLGVPTRKGMEKREGATLHSELVKQEEVDFQTERKRLMLELNNLSARVTNAQNKKEELLKKRKEAMDRSDEKRHVKQLEVAAARDRCEAIAAENEKLKKAMEAIKINAVARDKMLKQQQQTMLAQQSQNIEKQQQLLAQLSEKYEKKDQEEKQKQAEHQQREQEKFNRIQTVRAKLMDNEIQQILANFVIFDKNGDGVLDEKELTEAVKSVLKDSVSSEQALYSLIQDLIFAADENRDGKLSIAELRQAFAFDQRQIQILEQEQKKKKEEKEDAKKKALKDVRGKLMEDEIQKILVDFMLYDKNKDGVLDEKELTEAVKNVLKDSLSAEEAVSKIIKDLIAAADDNGDGKLSIQELRTVLIVDDRAVDAAKQEKANANLNSISLSATSAHQQGSASPPRATTSQQAPLPPNPKQEALARVRAKLMDDEIQQILVNFMAYDKNGDDVLDGKELTVAVTDAMKGNVSSPAVVKSLVRDLIAAADDNGDGKLSIKEIHSTFVMDERLLVELEQKQKQRRAEAEEAANPKKKALKAVRAKLMDDEIKKILVNFILFDKNADGQLDQTELTEAVKNALNGNVSDEKVIEQLIKDLIVAADDNGDGKLSVQEIRTTFAIDERQVDEASKKPVPVVETPSAPSPIKKPAQEQQVSPSAVQPTTNTVIIANSPSVEPAQQQQDPRQIALKNVRAKLMEDELRQILTNFVTYDKNGDGVLDETELTAAVISVLKGGMSSESAVNKLIKDLIAAADDNGDGKLSIQELRTTFAFDERILQNVELEQKKQQQAQEDPKKKALKEVRARLMEDEIQQILASFVAFDKNQDGVLDEEELGAAVKSAVKNNLSGEAALKQLVRDLIVAADENGDGKLSIQELRATFMVDERNMELAKQNLMAQQAKLQELLAREKNEKEMAEAQKLREQQWLQQQKANAAAAAAAARKKPSSGSTSPQATKPTKPAATTATQQQQEPVKPAATTATQQEPTTPAATTATQQQQQQQEPAKPAATTPAQQQQEPAKPAATTATQQQQEPAKPAATTATQQQQEPAKPAVTTATQQQQQEPAKPAATTATQQQQQEPEKPATSTTTSNQPSSKPAEPVKN